MQPTKKAPELHAQAVVVQRPHARELPLQHVALGEARERLKLRGLVLAPSCNALH